MDFIIKDINLNLCMSRKNKNDGLITQCTNLKYNNYFCKCHSKKWNCLVFNKPDTKTIKNYNNYLKIKNTKPLKYNDYIKNNKIINLTIPLLQNTLKYYKLPISGNKQNLINRLNNYFTDNELYFINESKIITIQKYYKKYLFNKELKLRGIGFNNKKIILNKEDFFTLEPIEDIENKYFISFKDEDNFVYGFDIRSFKKLIEKKMNNPYNRNPIPKMAIENLNKLLKIIKIEDNNVIKLSDKQKLNMKVIKIFQLMDELNLYAGGLNIDWFLKLDLQKLKNYYRYLEDIWNYRAEISQTTKYNIIGNNTIFDISVNNFFLINNINKCRYIILNEMEKLLINGIDTSNKYLGGLYILSALCNVSDECANSMPWLLN